MERAKEAAKAEQLSNLTFHVADAAKLSLDDFRQGPGSTWKFDLICAFDVIHDQAAPDSGKACSYVSFWI